MWYDRGMEFPVKLSARARKERYFAEFLDTIAVPAGVLDDSLRGFFGAYGKFRIDYPSGKKRETGIVIELLKKIIFRGRLTRLSPSLEGKIREIFPFQEEKEEKGKEFFLKLRDIYDSGYGDEKYEQLFDGGGIEKKFYTEILVPEVKRFGMKNQKDIIPQVFFGSFSGDEMEKRRLDFLVSHGVRRLAIEVDDPTHRGEEWKDSARDEFLRENGVEIFRITADQVREGKIEGLREKLGEIYEKYEIEEREGQEFFLGVKLAHIVQAILVKMAEKGVLERGEKVWFSEEMFFGLPKEKATRVVSAAVEDLKELSRNLAEIYGEEDYFSGISLGENCGFLVGKNPKKGFSGTEVLFQEISYSEPLINFRNFSGDFPRISGIKKKNLEFLLQYIFGFSEFRENQIDGILRAMRGEDSIVLLPTGSGKSVVYQLLAFLMSGTGIVVEPLRALMEDQVENLNFLGIDSVVNISGELGNKERKKIFSLIRQGAFSLIYVTPERMQMDDFRRLLHEAKGNKNSFPFFALDEAHCISEWGHDFRVAYLDLAETARKLLKRGKKKPVILALTGTASDSVLRDMERDLRVSEENVIRPNSFDRPEIEYRVFAVPSEGKMAGLEKVLKSEIVQEFQEEDFRSLTDLRGEETKAGIVFCVFKTGKTDFGVDSVYMMLKREGEANVAKFYGVVDQNERKMRANARGFKRNQASLMIATKAFGMGIDKPNIRYTVHYGIPNSIEAYYQEAGRAGRDGKRALSYIILSNDGPERNRELINEVLVEDLGRELKKGGKRVRDDVNRLLFLHQRNYDRKITMENFRGILEQIGTLKAGVKTIAAKSKMEFQGWQKTLFRMKILKIIEDYTILSFPNNEFKIRVLDFKPERIVRAYGAYVGRYQEGQAKIEMGKLKNKKYSGQYEFICSAMEILLDFAENVFERSRRRAIGNMLQLAEDGAKISDKAEQNKLVRQKILNHLGNSYGDLIRKILDDRTYIFTAGEILNGVRKGSEEKFLAEVRRTLQAYPEHPGLLMVAGVLGSIGSETAGEVAAEDLRAAMRNAVEKYGVDLRKVEEEIVRVIGETCRKNRDEERYKKFLEAFTRDLDDSTSEGLLGVLPKKYSEGIGARLLAKYNLVMISEIRSKIGIELWKKKS